MVEIGNDTLLFDHGPGAHHRLLETGKRSTDVTHIFFSHLHYDHCLDYGRLVLTRWDQGAGQIPELKVYGPKDTERMTRSLFAADGAYSPDLTARTSYPGSLAFYEARGGSLPRAWPNPVVSEIRSGQVIDGGAWKISVQAVVHQQPYLHCFGFRLDCEAGSFAYSGDCGPCKGMEKLAKDCDVLVHMCHFISGTALNEGVSKGSSGHLDVASLAAATNVRTLVLTHVTEQMDVPGVRERLLQEIGQVYSGNVIWGEDLMQIPLGDPLPEALR